MTWTSEKPTEAGWYWWRLDGVVAVVHITQPHWLSGTEPHKFIMYWYGQQYQLNQVGGEFKGPITPDSYQQGRVAAFKEVEQRFDSVFGATDRRIDSVRDYRIDKFFTWLAQQAQDEKGVGE